MNPGFPSFSPERQPTKEKFVSPESQEEISAFENIPKEVQMQMFQQVISDKIEFGVSHAPRHEQPELKLQLDVINENLRNLRNESDNEKAQQLSGDIAHMINELLERLG